MKIRIFGDLNHEAKQLAPIMCGCARKRGFRLPGRSPHGFKAPGILDQCADRHGIGARRLPHFRIGTVPIGNPIPMCQVVADLVILRRTSWVFKSIAASAQKAQESGSALNALVFRSLTASDLSRFYSFEALRDPRFSRTDQENALPEEAWEERSIVTCLQGTTDRVPPIP
jgi:hypothetical protein